jgi:hypothetical protein
MRTTRLQIDLTEQQLKTLEELAKEVGVSTKKELFNNALSILQWAVNQKRHGYIVGSINEADQKYRELAMPILDNVKPAEPEKSTLIRSTPPRIKERKDTSR